ncbi:hypothetical protein LPJ53_004674 [Coemansia erecta]|uniref:Symplekin/Pta1 N-terminal domain-containing protein n=1 Tax=Coemansia erecta TaxID=147472 RepID=A0A9W8CNY1_9FUNG|nr:hypothetical protein LPJ53_004674 [Coemansia erecta]
MDSAEAKPEPNARARELYSQAVHEVPPNRSMLDKLADYLRVNPHLLYGSMFTDAYDAANTIVGMQESNDIHIREALDVLTPPAVWGWAVMEDAVCLSTPAHILQTTYPSLAQQFLDLVSRTLDNMSTTPGPVVRRAVQALTRFWPVLIGGCIVEDPGNSAWRKMYETTLSLSRDLMNLSETLEDPAMQVHLVKLLEVEAVMFSPPPPTGDAPGHGIVNLNRIPDPHPYMNRAELGRRSDVARKQLINLLPESDNLRMCNVSFITGIINSLVYLMSMRPQFCSQILDRLTDWFGVINSSEQALSHSQLEIVSKSLRIMLLHLYTLKHMAPYSELLGNTLDSLGGSDWEAWQERQRHERRRMRAREEEMARRAQRQQQQQYPAGLSEGGVARDEAMRRDRSASVHAGQKRVVNLVEDEDEEYQARMLEENAKRVRLDEAGEATAGGMQADVRGVSAQTQQVSEKDKAMEAEVRAAVNSGPFKLQPTAKLSDDEREQLIVDAMKRIVSSSKTVEKFITYSRLQGFNGMSIQQSPADAAPSRAQIGSTEMGARSSLPNGLSTNAGVLEDSVLLLVRMISNCYVMYSNSVFSSGKPEGSGLTSKWSELHRCIDSVLETIKESPRTRYSLAIMVLYELWMAVISTDPCLEQQPGSPNFEYSAQALYLRWCEQIFDAIIKCSVETTIAQIQAQVVPDMNANAPGAPVPPQAPVPAPPTTDRLVLEYILDAPYLPPEYLKKLEVCMVRPETATLGFWTIEKAIEMRPPVFRAGLSILLSHSASHDRATRIGCIRAVKKHYMNSSESPLIEKTARASFKIGVKEADAKVDQFKVELERIKSTEATTPEEVAKREADQVALKQQGDNEVDLALAVHGEILLALCTRNVELLKAVFDEFVAGSPLVKRSIIRLIVPLVKSQSAALGRLMPVVAQFPEGSEDLAIRVIKTLALEGTAGGASRELVQSVFEMQKTRELDARFIAAVANGLTREEAIIWLGKIVSLLDGKETTASIIKDFFIQVTMSGTGRPSALSPVELLVALHGNMGSAVSEDKAEAAIVLYSKASRDGTTPAFNSNQFTVAINMLLTQEPIPPLVLKTVEIQHSAKNAAVGPAVSTLDSLVKKKFWEMGGTMTRAVARGLAVFLPGTLALTKNIPRKPLKKIIAMEPRLNRAIYDYAMKMPPRDQDHYKWLIKQHKK